MKHFSILLLLLLISGYGFSQEPAIDIDFENSTEETPLYIEVEKMPEPKGGMEAFSAFIAENLQYPATARSRGIAGRVSVRFVVTATGKIESLELLNKVDPALDQEAVRIIKLSEQEPGWIPGEEQGERVDVQIVQQISFDPEAAVEN